MTLNLSFDDFNQDVVDSALEIIKAEGFDLIYCSLTGVTVGHMSETEIRECLRIEQSRMGIVDVDQLVDDFATRHFIMSSGPAPSLRLQKDHHQLVRVLRSHSQGPASLLAYMAGRLFFDATIREKEISSSTHLFARTQFLVEIQRKLAALPENWHDSLTAEDEETSLPELTARVIAIAAPPPVTPLSEAKAAQRCLESFFRLDAIFNLRYSLYDESLRRDLIAMRDSGKDWSFRDMESLLSRLEADNIVKLQKQKLTHEGNAMILSAALANISVQGKRFARLEKNFQAAVSKGLATTKVGHIFEELRKLGLDSSEIDLSENAKREVERKLGMMQSELTHESFTEKRMAAIQHAVTRSGNAKGTVQRVTGPVALKHIVEAGGKLRPALEAKLKQAQAEKRVGKTKGEGKLKRLGSNFSFDDFSVNLKNKGE